MDYARNLKYLKINRQGNNYLADYNQLHILVTPKVAQAHVIVHTFLYKIEPRYLT